MRFAWIVRPQNMLLFSCHFTNIIAQFNLLQKRAKYEYENYKEGRPLDFVDPMLLEPAKSGKEEDKKDVVSTNNTNTMEQKSEEKNPKK